MLPFGLFCNHFFLQSLAYLQYGFVTLKLNSDCKCAIKRKGC